MKFRNFIIVLLAVLMAFAFASCKQEPKEEPKPTPKPYSGDLYQIEVTEGVDKDYYNRDKIKLVWNVNVKEGDTISLKYRSERDVYQWDIRNGSHKWVYETSKNGFVDPVLGDDGWYTMTYTIGKTIDGAAGASSALGIYFRGNFVTTDIFEIKEIMLNDEELEVVPETITSAAQLNDPAEEFDWSVKNYAVLFATGKPGEVDKTPIAEKVVAGGKVTGAPIAKENYSLTIYTDEAHTTVFDPETPITEEKIFYYEYVGDPRTVTYVTNSTTVIEPVQVHYNDLLTPPADPVLEGKAFKAWYKDSGLTTKWDFLVDHIEDNLTLYAGYGDPVTVTFDAQNGEAEHATATIAQGNPVAMPETPTNGTSLFTGWYTEAECTTAYNFAAPVEADITLYAGWVEAVNVTLNLNYEGAPEATVYKAPYGQALAENDANLAVEDDIIGMVYGGWYTEAACTNPYNYETVLTSDITLYAKWTEATLYRLIAKHSDSENVYSYDKLAVVHSTADVDDQDVLSFRFRTNRPFTFFSIRRAGGGKKWIYQNSNAEANYGFTSYETKEDGWTYVTYKFDKATAVDSADAGIPLADFDFEVHFGDRYGEPAENLGIMKGDILEIQDFAINGVSQTIAEGDVSSYAGATLSVVEGGTYEWTAHTVVFNTNGGSDIANASVDYGKFVDKPADPTYGGKVFSYWYSDAGLTNIFDFNTQIIEDTTIYAGWVAPVTLTFDSQEGSAVEAISTGAGLPITKPADPSREGYLFQGWFEDAECTVAFGFAAGIAADKTIYAKWATPLNLTYNLNYVGAPEATVAKVGANDAITEPKSPGRVGYFFDGWFTDAACTVAFDHAAGIAADTTVYAKWTLPTKEYKFTVTKANSRFQWRFKGSSVAILESIQPGDVITFQVKFTAASATPYQYRLRTYEDEKTIQSETAFPDADGDGWYSITITAPEEGGFVGKNGLYLALFTNTTWAIGDICEIKALAYNGQEITITTSTSSGIYPGVEASLAVLDL